MKKWLFMIDLLSTSWPGWSKNLEVTLTCMHAYNKGINFRSQFSHNLLTMWVTMWAEFFSHCQKIVRKLWAEMNTLNGYLGKFISFCQLTWWQEWHSHHILHGEPKCKNRWISLKRIKYKRGKYSNIIFYISIKFRHHDKADICVHCYVLLKGGVVFWHFKYTMAYVFLRGSQYTFLW